MRFPTPDELGLLGRGERLAFQIADGMNRHDALKHAAHFYLRTFGSSWVGHCTYNLTTVVGVENLPQDAPERGVVFACNHRSFFDLYVVSSHFLRICPWIKRMYFPVRSDFFYDQPAGTFVNAIMSAMAMYPPIFREQNRRSLNQYAVDALAEAIARPGTIVGIHPEGTRNKGENPYELLPAQPGVGQIAHQSRAIVIPVFVLGLINDFPKQVRSNFDKTGAPVTLHFGKPMDLSELYAEPGKLRTYKKITERVRDEIGLLGVQDQALRERLGLPSMLPASAAAADRAA